MFNFKIIFTYVLALILFPGVKSYADTFEVTNLNDPGAGSLRQAIDNSNSNPGPDKIVFSEGLSGTITLNLGILTITDDLQISGPGADRITIDADNKTRIFVIRDSQDLRSIAVKIIGLELINGNDDSGGAIVNFENLTIASCVLRDCSADSFAGAIWNVADDQFQSQIAARLHIMNSEFRNNQAVIGGAIKNAGSGIIEIITNSIFADNQANILEFSGAGAISNDGTINEISNSTFDRNLARTRGGAIDNGEAALIQNISNCTFTENAGESGGAIANAAGVINEILYSTFKNNIASLQGGAINNEYGGLIESISNSTIHNNVAPIGAAINNYEGILNISFTTVADNKVFGVEGEGVIATGPSAISRIRNSILSSNSPANCFGNLSDFGGNYSNDSTCGFTGDNADIVLGPLADNGGSTETMALLGGDPLDGATVNCDALNAMGNPAGIPIGIDQRYFPRPFGVRCDSGAFETQPTASVTITKVTSPASGRDFNFDSTGFGSLEGCGLRGDEGGSFVLNDGDSVNCTVPEGDYSIRENVPGGYELAIICLVAPDNITINNETGEIEFTIEGPGSDVDCVYTNTRTGGGNGGCSLTTYPASSSLAVIPALPLLIFIWRIAKKHKNRHEKEVSI